MDAQSYQPGEELADFTEDELLSLIDAGTTGAYSEIYRRYIDEAVARASSLPTPEARKVADEAFFRVLRSLLNKTAGTFASLQSTADDTINERLPPETVADRLNIGTAVVERLSHCAHQDLQKAWTRTSPKDSNANVDHRSALIPALLMSSTVFDCHRTARGHTRTDASMPGRIGRPG